MSQDGCHDLADLSDVDTNRTLVEGSNMKVEEKEKSADQTETISRETKKMVQEGAKDVDQVLLHAQ